MKLSKNKVIVIKVNDKMIKIMKADIKIFLSFFGFFEINVAIAFGKDKFDNEINKTTKGFTSENNPIASTPSSRFIRIFDSKEMNFALNPSNNILSK